MVETEMPQEEKPKAVIVEPLVSKCPEGPGDEHEWKFGWKELEEEEARCVHCERTALIVDIIMLYQRERNDLKRRLDHELGYKQTRFGASKRQRENCKTDREKELYDMNEYLSKRLQEEINVASKAKKGEADAIKTMKTNQSHFEASQKALSKEMVEKKKWKNAYLNLKADMKKHLEEMETRLEIGT